VKCPYCPLEMTPTDARQINFYWGMHHRHNITSVFPTPSLWSILACSAGVLLGRVNVTTLRPPSVRRWGMGEGKSEKIFFAPPPPLSFLLPVVHPLGRSFFLSPVFHCLKHLRGRENFLRCERSHEKISPALQARSIYVFYGTLNVSWGHYFAGWWGEVVTYYTIYLVSYRYVTIAPKLKNWTQTLSMIDSFSGFLLKKVDLTNAKCLWKRIGACTWARIYHDWTELELLGIYLYITFFFFLAVEKLK